MPQINNYSGSWTTNLITFNPRYPWFDEDDYKKLETAAMNRWLTWQAKTQFMDEAYQHYYPQVLNSHKLDERQVEINKGVAENGNAVLNWNKTAQWNMKLVDLAQTAKRVKWIAYDYPDDQLIETMKSNIPNWDKLLLNYLNDWDKELLYQAWLLETDAQQQSKAYNQKRQKINNALLNNWRELSDDWLKYVRDYNVMFQVVDEARQQGMWEGMNDNELLLNLIYASPELQQLEKEIGTLNLSKTDKAILRETDDEYAMWWNNDKNWFRNMVGWNSNTPATHEDLQEEIYVRENGWAKETWKNAKANIRNFGDSVEKFLYRAPKDFENWIYKNLPAKWVLEAEMGKSLTDEEYKDAIEDKLLNNKLSVKDYNESLNKEIQSYKDSIWLDPVIENYFNKHWIVESVMNGGWAGYKIAWETAWNIDTLLGMGASIINPAIWFMVMGTDTFMRENQESFDSLIDAQMKQWVSYEDAYDNASKWALVVGAVNTAIELWLEKFLGWVETTTAKNIKSMISKDLNKEVTDMVAKRWIADLLKRWLTTQARASMEEWLEEIFQQLTQNIAASQYDPDKKISEWLWEAFEWGALNPMNLLAWTTEIISAPTLSDTDKQTFVNWANTLDVGWTQVADGFNPKSIVNNIKNWWLYSIAPTLSNIQQDNQWWIYNQAGVQANSQVDNQANDWSSFGEFIEEENFDWDENEQKTEEGVKKEGRFDKELDWLDNNVRERIRNNPYAIESSKEVINNLKNNPWFDYLDWQTEQYENILDSIVEKLDNADQKRSKDVGVLYDDLEKANKPIDVTNIQNNLEQYQRSIEDLGDVLSNTDKARLQNILKNIEEIWDWTMDVWKVRKIIDRFAKKWDWVTSYWLNLMKQIRKDIDNEIQQQNPDMKEVDKEYTKALDEIRELQWDLVYKKTWELKNNAVSTVKNMLNPKNRLYLNTLEKYIPWIKQQLQWIRDSKFVFDAYTTWNGSRFIWWIRKGVGKWLGWIVWGWLGYAFGPLWVIWWAVLGNIIQWKIDSALTKKAQQALERTVWQETEASKAELERINQKIAENQQLEASEKAKLEALWKKILQSIENVDKTKEEQWVWDTIKEISFRDAWDLWALPLDAIRNKEVWNNPTDVKVEETVEVEDDPIVDEKTGQRLSEAVENLRKYWWDEKAIENYKDAIIKKMNGETYVAPKLTLDEMIEDAPVEIKEVYHGTREDAANEILKKWWKIGSELDENAYRGWGYGAIQDVISFATDKDSADVFANASWKWVVLKSILKKWANIVKMNWIEYAEELSEYLPELRERGIDAVVLDNGENELVVINKDIIGKTQKVFKK